MVAKNNLDLSALDNLSQEERDYALQILQDYAQGSAKLFDELKYADYKEAPVDIVTFIKDNNYLGRAWHLSDGKCKLFPFWEKKLQELFPDNLSTDYNTFIESGARGLGKAQPLDSLVFTEHGYRRMGDIQLGDRVYGNDGKLHNVIGVFPQGIKPVCKITFSDKTTTLCSDEHLWTVYDNAHRGTQKETKTVTCRELYETGVKLKSGGSRYRIPITQPLEFSHKDTLISPYLMGVLLGDGGFSSHSVGFTTYDKEIYTAVEQEIKQHDYSLHPNSQSLDNSSWYFTNNKYVKGARTPNLYVEYGKTLGLAGKHSWEKFIPDVYLYNDADSRLALLQGLMDTDGEIDPTYQEAYSTTSEVLAQQVVFLVQSLGGTAILKKYTDCSYVYKGEKRPCRDTYNINIKMPHDLLPCRLARKLERLNPRRLRPFRYIKNIEYVEPQECQCILLDSKDHLYLTNDLIVTHNSEIAVAISLYLMHRLMCLKDPYLTLNLKPTEQVAFAFMNITQDLAMDIGMVKFQNTVQCSPWFMERGTMSGLKVKKWNPPDFIKIIVGSQSSDVIGQAIYYCLDGDTVILTDKGEKPLHELVGEKIRVPTVNSEGEIELSETCTVLPTIQYQEEYQIELEDGSVIKCTPEHRFMLKDGSYKQAKDLTETDDIVEFKPFGYVYKTTNKINGKIYIGLKQRSTFDTSYLGSGDLIQRSIKKYGKDSFYVEVLDWAPDKKSLDLLEQYYITLYRATDRSIGYNIATGGQGGNLGAEVNHRISEKLKGHPSTLAGKCPITDCNGNIKYIPSEKELPDGWSYGNSCSGKMKITDGKQELVVYKDSEVPDGWHRGSVLKGKPFSESHIQNMKDSFSKRTYENYHSTSGRICITNGIDIKFVDPNTPIQDGWRLGNCKTAGKHNMSCYTSEMREHRRELSRGSGNNMWGQGYKVSGGNNGKAKVRYFYENKMFECRKDLLHYLTDTGYKIPVSVIRAAVQGQLTPLHQRRYGTILSKLKWRNKDED